LLGLLCHLLPLLFRYSLGGAHHSIATNILQMSRASSVVMLLAYLAYIFFQLKTHRKLFDAQEVIIYNLPYTMYTQFIFSYIISVNSMYIVNFIRFFKILNFWACLGKGFVCWTGGGRWREGSDRILECIYVVGGYDIGHILAFWICSRNNRGMYLFVYLYI